MMTWNDSMRLVCAAISVPTAVSRQRRQRHLEQQDDEQRRAVGDVDQSGQQQHDRALDGGHGGAAEALADHQGAAAHRSDQHLPQEAELPVPDDRDR